MTPADPNALADRLGPEIERWAAADAGAPARVANLRRLAGGACQEAWSLDMTVDGGRFAGAHGMVLRRDGGGAMNPDGLSRVEEFRVIEAARRGGVPVPRPYFASADVLGREGFLMERLEGETVGRRLVQDPRFADARAALPEQAAAALAAIHAVDWQARGLDFLPRPAPGQTPADRFLRSYVDQLAALDEPHPALELAVRWLRRHAPPPGDVTFVHGDFRLGNFMVGPEGVRAVLDWEFAHVGDPYEDLAWPTLRAWRFGVDRLAFAGVSPLDTFLDAYAKARGRRVDPNRLFYWQVMGNFAWAVGALQQSRRHLRGEEPSVELAALGRVCAEMELELLDLIERR